MKSIKAIVKRLREIVRTAIRRLALRVQARKRPLRIILGAGRVPVEGWLLTDMDQLNVTREADWKRYFEHGSIDAILAEHVWEHLTYRDGEKAASFCYLFLRAGGRLRIAVPDGLHPDPEYIEAVRPMGSGPGAEDHKVLYTFESLRKLLESVGFNTYVLECFDEEGRFICSEWDPEDGMVRRSFRFDSRNCDAVPRYTSIVIDAVKPST
jgi:predicted SAM-dependent methyltransferase